MVDKVLKKEDVLEEAANVKNEVKNESPSAEEVEKKEITQEEANEISDKNDDTSPDVAEMNKTESGGKEEDEDILQKKKRIKDFEREIKELKEKNLRAYAELDNFKKRTIKEREDLIKYGNEELINSILPVVDHLEMALEHKPNENTEGAALHQGVELTLKELLNTLKKYGLKGIDAVGLPFDPLVHHAMSQVESEEAEENTVISEFRKGYMLHDRVLRASLVSVSKKPEKKENDKNRQSEEE
jgi:molecular chaperone GrpE